MLIFQGNYFDSLSELSGFWNRANVLKASVFILSMMFLSFVALRGARWLWIKWYTVCGIQSELECVSVLYVSFICIPRMRFAPVFLSKCWNKRFIVQPWPSPYGLSGIGERPFKCDNCSYLAANQHEVTRHARQVHNGPKPLSCPYCQYKTADRSNFKKHVELHVNPRQFLCPVCKYAASKKCNLQYHIKSRHPGCTDISMDVSKVRLRVKRTDSDDISPDKLAIDQSGSRQSEDKQLGELDDVNPGPINLSIKKPTKPTLAVETELTDKTTKKNPDVIVKEKSGKPTQKLNEKTSEKKRRCLKMRGKRKTVRRLKERLWWKLWTLPWQ